MTGRSTVTYEVDRFFLGTVTGIPLGTGETRGGSSVVGRSDRGYLCDKYLVQGKEDGLCRERSL